MEIKFTVLKNEDIKKHLTEVQKDELDSIIETIENGRLGEGKRRGNTYIVINTDEPYVQEVIEIMKRNGHWDEDCFNVKGIPDRYFVGR
jgi:uncharacterized protein YaaQ